MVDYKNIPTEGIVNISSEDVKYAEALGYTIKLIGYAEFSDDNRLYSRVCPMLVNSSAPLSGVDGVFNAVMVTGNNVGDTMFYGKGAGKLPTASAVVADVIDAVKHIERSKRIAWVDEGSDFMIAPDGKAFSFFFRTDCDEKEVKSLFDIEASVEVGIAGEKGYITKSINEAEFRNKIDSIKNVPSVIRVME